MSFQASLKKITRCFVRPVLERGVDVITWIKRYRFPKKYTWRWKLEALFGRYEPETVRLCKRILKPGMNVIDIGGHIGYFTRLFASQVGPTGHVLAFEADPTNFELLKYNTHGKRLITISPLAIANQVGTINFFESPTNTGCHSLIPSNERSQKISIQATTLDTWYHQGLLQKVDFIKMDIEGGEPGALQGMQDLWKANPNLLFLFEVHPENLRAAGTNPEALLRQFTDRGYALFLITKQECVPIAVEKFFKIDGESANVLATKTPASIQE